MSSGRIIFVNRFYWPEKPATGQLLTDLATALVADGARVLVLTSGTRGIHPARESHSGVEIRRVFSPRWAHGNVLGKGAAFGTFFLGATFRLQRLARRGDTIVVMTDPPLLGVAAAIIARISGVRLIHWVQDIYPEIAVAVTGHRWLRALGPWRNLAWRAAAICVAVGDDMQAFVRRVSGANAVAIANWAPAGLRPLAAEDPAVRSLRRSWGLEDRFVIGYSGNLGRVHDLAPVLAAAAALREEPKIAFVFVGGGAQRKLLEAESQRLGLENVRFVAAQPREQLGAALAVADVHLVTLKPGCESFVFPSKLYGVAAAGRPVLFVGPPDCEVARLVRSAAMGRTADSTQPAELVDAIREFATQPKRVIAAGAAARAFAREYDFDRARSQWRQVLWGQGLPNPTPATTPISSR